jgi:hypothetical protein
MLFDINLSNASTLLPMFLEYVFNDSEPSIMVAKFNCFFTWYVKLSISLFDSFTISIDLVWKTKMLSDIIVSAAVLCKNTLIHACICMTMVGNEPISHLNLSLKIFVMLAFIFNLTSYALSKKSCRRFSLNRTNLNRRSSYVRKFPNLIML